MALALHQTLYQILSWTVQKIQPQHVRTFVDLGTQGLESHHLNKNPNTSEQDFHCHPEGVRMVFAFNSKDYNLLKSKLLTQELTAASLNSLGAIIIYDILLQPDQTIWLPY